MALPQIKQDATDARLASLTVPDGGWSEAARQDAVTRVRTTMTRLPRLKSPYSAVLEME